MNRLALGGALLAAAALLAIPGVLASSPTAPNHGTPVAPRAAGTALAAPASMQVPAGHPAAPRPSAAPVLGMDAATPSAIDLNWSAGSVPFLQGFVNYTIAESTTGSGGPWTTVGVVTSAATTSLAVGSLSPAASYAWEVTMYSSGLGSSAQTSNVLNATQPPPAVLTYTQPNPTHAQFNWTNSASYGANLSFVSYELFESVNGSAASLVGSIPTVGTTTYTVSGIAGGGGYSFYLVTTDCIGCAGGSGTQQGTNSNTVTFGTPETLVASVAAGQTYVDVHEADLFTCSASGGTPQYNFSWDFGNGTKVAGTYGESHAYPAPGIFTVTCYVADASHGSASSVTTVHVNPDPMVHATSNLTGADAGQTVGFGCSVSNGTQPFASLYQWNFGDGSVGQSAVPSTSHTYSAAGTYHTSCLATDAAQVSATGNVSVAVSKALVVALEPAALTVAPGFALGFTAVAANGSGTYSSYAWTFPGGGTATGRTATHAFPSAGANGSVTVAVTDSNGQTVRARATIAIVALTVTETVSPGTARVGAMLTFNASATGGAGGPFTFLWTFGDGTTATGATVHHAYSAVRNYTPTVKVTDHLGASTVSSGASVPVTAPPPPPAPTPFPWWIVAVVLAVVAVAIALLLITRRRRRESEKLRSATPWAPPTAPKHTVLGSKVCPSCGTSNVRLRTTCEVCGTDLPSR